MIHSGEPVSYSGKTVKEWIDKARSGELALPNFQRSYVWKMDKVKGYIQAIFDGKPVNLFLVLECAGRPQFKPRHFRKMETSLDDVKHLLLDGQQRMTSLLQCFDNVADSRIFLKIIDWNQDRLKVESVEAFKRNSKNEKRYRSENTAFDGNYLPFDVLKFETDEDGLTDCARWSMAAHSEGSDREKRILEQQIVQLRDEFYQRSLWACFLGKSVNRQTAIEIFVETNKSSIPLSRFDIEVADALGDREETFRDLVKTAYRENEIFKIYFPGESDVWIPKIGEWALKISCLRNDMPPKESNYGSAIKNIFGEVETKTQTLKFDELIRGLRYALEISESRGSSIPKMIPSMPTLHVIAALQGVFESINKPERINRARKLLRAFYWRTLFSDRYEKQANDRLFEDYNHLAKALEEIKAIGDCHVTAPAFDSKAHPLCRSERLNDFTPWIGSASRSGKAVASLVLSARPKDWLTGQELNPQRVRRLEEDRNLDRHHVFPVAALRKAGIRDRQKVNSGLNGVFIDGRTNKRLSKEKPETYIEKALHNDKNLSREELQGRIEQHLVPYRVLAELDNLEQRYTRFLSERAKIIGDRIEEVTAYQH